MYPVMTDRKDPDEVTLTDRAERISLEGNINNRSGIIKRPIDDHIRGFIRIPDGYRYEWEEETNMAKYVIRFPFIKRGKNAALLRRCTAFGNGEKRTWK